MVERQLSSDVDSAFDVAELRTQPGQRAGVIDGDPDAEVREQAALVLDAIAKSRATSHDEGEAKS